jgi:fructokinase
MDRSGHGKEYIMTAGPNQRIVIFGEVLYDCFPDQSAVLGGAPFNVAWHLQAFGLSPLFVSRVGDDPLGRRIRDAMQDWGLDTSALQFDARHPTGRVEVTLEAGQPRFAIVPEQAYDFIDARDLPSVDDCALLYHGSLALRQDDSRQALERLKQCCRGKVFLDVNLRNPWWRPDAVRGWLDAADWVKLNDDELVQLRPQSTAEGRAMQDLLEAHALELLIVTRGAAGAVLISAAGEEVAVAPSGRVAVVDTVGAGDAFTSVLLLGLTRGWPLSQTLERAQEFASAIVGVRGATVADPGFYRPFINAWRNG